MKERAEELGVQLLLHDIDAADAAVADELVKEHGDWTPDYLVPQVFVEYEDGKIEHVLTGSPQGVSLTKKAVEALLESEPFRVEGSPS